MNFVSADEEINALEDRSKLSYNVEVKLLNVGENFHAPQPGSADFDNLANTVASNFRKKFTKFPGFHKMDVTQFFQCVIKYYYQYQG